MAGRPDEVFDMIVVDLGVAVTKADVGTWMGSTRFAYARIEVLSEEDGEYMAQHCPTYPQHDI